jgi:hypothetical protein
MAEKRPYEIELSEEDELALERAWQKLDEQDKKEEPEKD